MSRDTETVLSETEQSFINRVTGPVMSGTEQFSCTGKLYESNLVLNSVYVPGNRATLLLNEKCLCTGKIDNFSRSLRRV